MSTVGMIAMIVDLITSITAFALACTHSMTCSYSRDSTDVYSFGRTISQFAIFTDDCAPV